MYKVIYESTLKDLKDKVNLLIKEGFIPQGGLCINQGYYQAMYKHVLQ